MVMVALGDFRKSFSDCSNHYSTYLSQLSPGEVEHGQAEHVRGRSCVDKVRSNMVPSHQITNASCCNSNCRHTSCLHTSCRHTSCHTSCCHSNSTLISCVCPSLLPQVARTPRPRKCLHPQVRLPLPSPKMLLANMCAPKPPSSNASRSTNAGRSSTARTKYTTCHRSASALAAISSLLHAGLLWESVHSFSTDAFGW